jgi:4'-phosphopantetheinyl transferase
MELNDGEVHVWKISAGPNMNQDEQLERVLSADERHRAKQFRFDKDRWLYTAAHAAMRSLLAFYLGVPGDQIQLVSGTHGKPSLAPADTSRLEFNLSHSHELALLAVTRGRAVGVDVEFIKSDFGFHEIARRFFTAGEVSALSALPPALQRSAFFKCWTSKEAFLKAKATGLSGKLDEVQIVLTGDGLLRIEAEVPGWSLSELQDVDGYAAALVLEGGDRPVHCFSWEPLLMMQPRL